MPSRSTSYRNKLKEENPEKYKAYLQEQRKRAKANRDKLKTELGKKRPSKASLNRLQVIREQTRQRQAKYSAKLKENGAVPKKTLIVKLNTRNAEKSQRERWAEAKRRCRAKLSAQKKQAIRKKDRERKKLARQTNKVHQQQKFQLNGNSVEKQAGAFNSRKALWNAVSKARRNMPKNASKFVDVHNNLRKNCSPKKRSVFQHHTCSINSGQYLKQLNGKESSLFSPVVKQAFKEMKGVTAEKKAIAVLANKLKKFASKRKIAKEIGLGRCAQWGKKRMCAIANNKKILVQKFYKREDISRVLPNKRYATKKGPTYLLQMPVRTALAKFREENKMMKIGYAQFARLRPLAVRLLSKRYREYCLCVYCVNVRYKILSLNRLMDDASKKLSHESKVLDILLCAKSERFHDISCIRRECQHCRNFRGTLLKYYEGIDNNRMVTWMCWKRAEDPRNGKVRRMLKTRTGTVAELLEEFVQDILKPSQGITYIEHLNNANWQYMQYNYIKAHLPRDWMLQVIDFAKNRNVMYNEEIKGAFFSPEQITLHPVVSYYRKGTELVRHSVVVLSDDNTHDYHAVNHFMKQVNGFLSSRGVGKKEVRVLFSDGCSAQYKSCGPFGDLSFMPEKVSRNFYGSEHGKGEGDGEIGVINKKLDNAICSGTVINNAEDAFSWCQQHLTLDEELPKRDFIFVKNGDIVRNRPYTEVKTIPGTRRIHQAQNFPGKGYTIEVRSLSCFCKGCRRNVQMSTSSEECINSSRVEQFRIVKMKPLHSTDDMDDNENPSVSDEKADDPVEILRRLDEAAADVCDDIDINEDEHLELVTEKEEPKCASHVLHVPVGEADMSADLVFTECPVLTELIDDYLETQERKQFFANLQNILKQLDFSSIKNVAAEVNQKIVEKYPIRFFDPKFCESFQVDRPSEKLYSGPPHLTPVKVYDDGNCLPRSGSILAFGNEERHIEMRVRIVLELAANKDFYMNPRLLHSECEDILKWYSTFSGDFQVDLFPEEVFDLEVVHVVKDGVFMGIWQLHSLASILGMQVYSVYPHCVGATLLHLLNRVLHPRVKETDELAYILWTNVSGPSKQGKMWAPNHFVPCIPKAVIALPEQPKPGVWIAVRLPVLNLKKGYRIFFGKILDVDSQRKELHIQYLKEHGRHYVIDETSSGKSWESFADSVVIPTPKTTLNNRQHYFIEDSVKKEAHRILLKQ